MAFNQREILYIFDEPIPYKNLLIYPARMKNYLNFHIYAQCLILEKNSSNDIKAIKMNYLQYMYSINNSENKLVLFFEGLLRLTTKIVIKGEISEIKEFKFGTINGKAGFQINGISFDFNDFDNIRMIIAEQNFLELPDEKVQKDVRDKIKEAQDYKNKISGEKIASLEDQIIALSAYTGWDLDKIYNLTIRKFTKAIRRVNHMIYSQIYLQASLSGLVEFKDKSAIKGWLADLEDNVNKDVIMELDDLQSTVGMANGNTK